MSPELLGLILTGSESSAFYTLFTLPGQNLPCSFTASGSVLFHPCDILVHSVLQELFAVSTEVAGLVKQPILYMNECFGLAKRRYVQICKNIAQMLLCQGRADGADRSAQNTSRLPCETVLAIRTRSVIDCVLEYAWYRAVVFRLFIETLKRSACVFQ